jgi:nucleotide-binding universal stress UspA family protein
VFSRILVPLDGSKLAERALDHARCIAKTFSAQVVLLTVQDPSMDRNSSLSVDPLRWQIQKTESELYLQSVTAHLKQDHVDVVYHILEGNAAENIVNFAVNENIDLVIISTHGWSGLSRWETSSVVKKVIEKIYLPVLIVRSFQSPEEVGTHVPYQRILIPMDGSRRAECSLPTAIALAQDLNASLYTAHVIQKPVLPFTVEQTGEITQSLSNYMQVHHKALDQYMENLRQRVPVPTEVQITEGNNIPRALHEIVHAQNIDLIVMCAHGSTGVIDWPYGSVAYNLLKYGLVTTLVIQDIARAQIRPSPAELAAENIGKR